MVTESYQSKMPNVNIYDKVGAEYLQHFRQQQQAGAGYVDTGVYRGARRWQKGDGIGDVLRGIARFMLPVLVRGASAFAGETISATTKGASLGDAARGALKPALNAAMQSVGERLQGGVGSPKRKGKRSKRRTAKSSVMQKGSGRKKSSAKRVYKGGSKKKRIHTTQFGGKAKSKKSGKKSGGKRKAANLSNSFSNF
jgi:hypothetical protein